MAIRCLALLLPALAVARISIEMSGTIDRDINNLDVTFTGSEVSIISDLERTSFTLTDSAVKAGVKAYFGAQPDDVYLRSPTPWGDLYQTYGWAETARTLRPIAAKVLNVTSQPTIVLEQIFENNSSKPATFNVGISQAIANTVASRWYRNKALTVEQDISYAFDLTFSKLSGSTYFSYTNTWGEDVEKSENRKIGSESTVEVLLQPGQSVQTELHSTRGSVQVEVVYEASLSGKVAVNYDELFKGHHFWNVDISGVMQGLGMKNSVVSKEVINVGFYSKGRIVAHDRKMGFKLLDIAL